jgi:L-xylulokinase
VGTGVGLFDSPRADPRDMDSLTTTYDPDPGRAADLARRYKVFTDLIAALSPLWPRIEALSGDIA